MRLAARGARERDGGVVAVADPHEAEALRARARRIHATALTSALALTALLVALAAARG